MWIALIKREEGRFDRCRHIIEMAQRGEVQVWTSDFTLAEVFKRRCGSGMAGIDAVDDEAFEDYIEQDFVFRVQVDSDIGKAARRLLREHPTLNKPQDAIHLASALFYDIDELHTFDHYELLALSDTIQRRDGNLLRICKPPSPLAGTLFESADDDQDPEAQRTA
jgi:predicted nucleic acid-binding protein